MPHFSHCTFVTTTTINDDKRSDVAAGRTEAPTPLTTWTTTCSSRVTSTVTCSGVTCRLRVVAATTPSLPGLVVHQRDAREFTHFDVEINHTWYSGRGCAV